jgi:hypothetical protein
MTACSTEVKYLRVGVAEDTAKILGFSVGLPAFAKFWDAFSKTEQQRRSANEAVFDELSTFPARTTTTTGKSK